MNQKEINEQIRLIKKAQIEEDFLSLDNITNNLISELFRENKYNKIVDLIRKGHINMYDYPIFEVAFSLSREKMYDESQEIYEHINREEPENTSVLNNLYIIYNRKGDKRAFNFIEKAYSLTKGNDTTIKKNYETEIKEKQKLEEKETLFKASKQFINKETERALDKLKNFLVNIKKDEAYNSGSIAIPKWKFKVLIGTDESKSQSLQNQWIERGYIFKGLKTLHQVQIYEINPYLEDLLKSNEPIKLNKNWIDGIENINIDNLNNIGYFHIAEKIKKIPKKYNKYQNILLRDFNELVINYVMGNKKTVIILGGSLIELIFTYYCEKNKYSVLEYQTLIGKKKKVQLLDATLFDFLSFFEEEGNLQQITMTIGNLARIYRNYIHPGNEIKLIGELDKSKTEICFNSAIECINSII